MSQTAIGTGTEDTIPAGKGYGDNSGPSGKWSDGCIVWEIAKTGLV